MTDSNTVAAVVNLTTEETPEDSPTLPVNTEETPVEEQIDNVLVARKVGQGAGVRRAFDTERAFKQARNRQEKSIVRLFEALEGSEDATEREEIEAQIAAYLS